jgi:hypothetical protein
VQTGSEWGDDWDESGRKGSDPRRPSPGVPTSEGSSPATRAPETGEEGEEERGEGAQGLPRQVTEFLVSFSMALHRVAMYPPSHPSLAPAIERMMLQLAPVLGDRGALTLGITNTQLLLDGGSTPENHHGLSDLARRLHGHQLGALVLRRGVDLEELSEALAVLARDPVRGERPLGLLPSRDRPGWPHIQLLPVEYGALELAGDMLDEGEVLSVRELWLVLFRTLFEELDEAAGEGLHAGGPLPTGEAMARALSESLAAAGEEGGTGGQERQREVVDALTRLLGALQWQGDAEGQDLRLRAAELIEELDPDLLGLLLRQGTDRSGGRNLLLRAARAGLPSHAVLRVLDAVMEAGVHPVPPPVHALLLKLARAGEGIMEGFPDSAAISPEARSEARSVFREEVEGLVQAWRREAGEKATDARDIPWGPPASADRPELLARPTPVRIVELALASDAVGPVLDAALEVSLRRGNVFRALELAESAPPESKAAARVEAYLLTPPRLRTLLGGDDVDEASLRQMVDVLGEASVDPLFDALASSESRAVRRKIFDRLVAMGPRIAPLIMQYLESDAWYVRRNMLALLQRHPTLPPGFSPLAHLQHEDDRVRREALPLALRDPGSREAALELALTDPDDRISRQALLELQESLPDRLVPLLVSAVLETPERAHLRSLAVRALGGSRHPDARASLEALCTTERGLLLGRRRRLADPSPELFAALHALARGWSDDPEVAWIFEAARTHEDPRVRLSARGER